jgi:hypothetical protein
MHASPSSGFVEAACAGAHSTPRHSCSITATHNGKPEISGWPLLCTPRREAPIF